MPARRRTYSLAAALLVVFAVAWFTGRQVGVSTSLTTCLYDVRELLIDIPDFDEPPNFALSPQPPPAAQTRPAATQTTVEQRLDGLTRLIKSTVESTSWEQPGRSITHLHNHLAITQTADAHERIAEFLRNFRESRAVTITVEAQLLEVYSELIHPRSLPAGRAVLSDAEMRRFLDSFGPSWTEYSPRISLFSGQRAYTLVSTQRAFVSGVAQINKADGVVYDPRIGVAEFGWVFDVQATANSERNAVTLTLRPQFSQLLGFESTTQRTPDGKSHPVQRPVLDYKTIRATTTVPDGHWWLTEMSAPPTTQASSRPATRPSKKHFLLIKPTIARPKGETDAKVLPSGK